MSEFGKCFAFQNDHDIYNTNPASDVESTGMYLLHFCLRTVFNITWFQVIGPVLGPHSMSVKQRKQSYHHRDGMADRQKDKQMFRYLCYWMSHFHVLPHICGAYIANYFINPMLNYISLNKLCNSIQQCIQTSTRYLYKYI